MVAGCDVVKDRSRLGVANANQNLGRVSSNLLDFGVILGSTLVLLAISARALRRQSEVLAIV